VTGQTISHYKILERLGAGGMGVVYKAHDKKLDRTVALKFLPSAVAASPQERARFIVEAKAASALESVNICSIHEIGETERGELFIAMPCYEGRTLKQRIAEGSLPPREAANIGAQIARGLAKAHGRKIIHRDIKPANAIVTQEGIVKVLDFGLAKLAADPEITQTIAGTTKGTVGYMSPEQAEGLAVDLRTDLWSLGVVLYEMLAGHRPFRGDTPQAILRAVGSEAPPSLNHVPPELERIVNRCLQKDRDQRYGSAEELVRDLERFSGFTQPAEHSRNARRTMVAVLAGLCMVGAIAGWLMYRSSKRQWARYEAIPQARALAEQGRFAAAYNMTEAAARFIPDDSTLRGLWPDVSHPLTVQSEPPGAEVEWRLYAEPASAWRALGTTPIERRRVPAGPLRLRVSKAGFELVEVAGSRDIYRFKLEPKGSIPAGMVRVSAGSLNLDIRGMGRLRAARLGEFLIDRYEVTNRQFNEFVAAGGYSKREYWKTPIMKDGHVLPWELAMKVFADPTGQPGPATWEAGFYPDGKGDHPVTGVSWYEAAAYAAYAGKSLPTVYQWMRTANPNESAFQIPLSNFGGIHSSPARSSEAIGVYGAYDMAGNAREWCWNESGGSRFILGGSWSDPSYMLTRGQTAPPLDRSNTNGFRCVKDTRDGDGMATLTAPLAPYRPPDYLKATPVADDAFEVYRNLYRYEKTPLDAAIDAIDETSDLYRREKVHFRAAYGNESVIAYLFVPKEGKPPFQCVVYFPGGNSRARGGKSEEIRPDTYILRSGRAMLYPIYKGTYERFIEVADEDPIQVRDGTIAISKDLGRSIDYLETRKDIDIQRVAYLGVSWGGETAPMLLAAESRIRTAVLLSGGMASFFGALPEINTVNFLGRVKIPVLMVNGRYDTILPPETAQEPMFSLWGATPANKKYVTVASGHGVNTPEARNDVVREVLSWLDDRLGKTSR
jgi:eukaryotic-like serine/threonine-protein kinase